MKVNSWYEDPELESEYLFKESKLKKNAEISDRLKCLALAIEGWTAYKISLKLDVTRQSVFRWVSWYNDAGIDGLWDKQYGGRAKRISDTQIEQLKQVILAGPSKESGLSRFRGIDIVKFLKEKYQIEYSLSSVYRILEEMGLSYIKPRPLHSKQNTTRQNAWKSAFAENKKKPGDRGLVPG